MQPSQFEVSEIHHTGLWNMMAVMRSSSPMCLIECMPDEIIALIMSFEVYDYDLHYPLYCASRRFRSVRLATGVCVNLRPDMLGSGWIMGSLATFIKRVFDGDTQSMSTEFRLAVKRIVFKHSAFADLIIQLKREETEMAAAKRKAMECGGAVEVQEEHGRFLIQTEPLQYIFPNATEFAVLSEKSDRCFRQDGRCCAEGHSDGSNIWPLLKLLIDWTRVETLQMHWGTYSAFRDDHTHRMRNLRRLDISYIGTCDCITGAMNSENADDDDDEGDTGELGCDAIGLRQVNFTWGTPLPRRLLKLLGIPFTASISKPFGNEDAMECNIEEIRIYSTTNPVCNGQLVRIAFALRSVTMNPNSRFKMLDVEIDKCTPMLREALCTVYEINPGLVGRLRLRAGHVALGEPGIIRNDPDEGFWERAVAQHYAQERDRVAQWCPVVESSPKRRKTTPRQIRHTIPPAFASDLLALANRSKGFFEICYSRDPSMLPILKALYPTPDGGASSRPITLQEIDAIPFCASVTQTSLRALRPLMPATIISPPALTLDAAVWLLTRRHGVASLSDWLSTYREIILPRIDDVRVPGVYPGRSWTFVRAKILRKLFNHGQIESSVIDSDTEDDTIAISHATPRCYSWGRKAYIEIKSLVATTMELIERTAGVDEVEYFTSIFSRMDSTSLCCAIPTVVPVWMVLSTDSVMSSSSRLTKIGKWVTTDRGKAYLYLRAPEYDLNSGFGRAMKDDFEELVKLINTPDAPLHDDPYAHTDTYVSSAVRRSLEVVYKGIASVDWSALKRVPKCVV